MAEIAPVSRFIHKGVLQVSWANVSKGDTGEPADLARFPDKTIYVKGPFSTGGTCSVEGGNATSAAGVTTWVAIVDPQGNAISAKTAEFMEALLEAPRFVRITVTAGDSGTAINATILCGGAK